MEPAQQVDRLLDNLFREEAGKMTAVLTRLLGFQSLGVAEDIVQETLLRALSVWKFKGIPENPAAWLYTVARRLAIDHLRKQSLELRHAAEFAQRLASEWTLASEAQSLFLEHEIQDSQLRLMFACCHPEIPAEAQVALILKTLCGLGTREIAAGFLTQEDTIQKRLVRARQRLKEVSPSLETPAPVHLRERLDMVLLALYLLFNEGYYSRSGSSVLREDLCADAIRLCRLLVNASTTDVPDARALLALMYFQASRFPARMSGDSQVLLNEQDRSLWNRELIAAGERMLNSAATGNHLSSYHLEAAIAACHSNAERFDVTDWTTIARLYDQLVAIHPSPPAQLNRAIAKGYSNGPARGIEELLSLQAELKTGVYYYAALGDFYMKQGDDQTAGEHYAMAVSQASNPLERRMLEEKIKRLPRTGS